MEYTQHPNHPKHIKDKMSHSSPTSLSRSRKRNEVGRGTILELNQSETALTQAELTYMQSIYNYLVNKADLDYTLGRE